MTEDQRNDFISKLPQDGIWMKPATVFRGRSWAQASYSILSKIMGKLNAYEMQCFNRSTTCWLCFGKNGGDRWNDSNVWYTNILGEIYNQLIGLLNYKTFVCLKEQ